MPILYHSTNNHRENVGFREAILNGIASNYGLYMMKKEDLPEFSIEWIKSLVNKSYADTALKVLLPFVEPDIGKNDFKKILEEAYNERIIPVNLQHLSEGTHILWLSRGPTYSFKDFAARFFGRVLNYFLGESDLKRTVIVATSGDTGGAVADALFGLDNITNIVFFPRDAISEAQRRQMTTLGGNIYAFSVNGDFDICQELAKTILGNRTFAEECFGDPYRFTSANSISLGRLLPQAVYPFYAYSRMELDGESFTASIPSGNFGDMMGTILAKHMGLPVKKIVCGVNENRVFPEFLSSGKYKVKPSVWSPSTAMIVSHPSNLARLIEFFGGHIYDQRDSTTGKVIRSGVIDRMPDLKAIKRDIYSVSISNKEHYDAINEVYKMYGVILDPHGAVGWKALQYFQNEYGSLPAVIYETADPGKFPDDIEKAIGIKPEPPPGIKKQAFMKERVYTIDSPPEIKSDGSRCMSSLQYEEAKRKIKEIFN